MGGTPPAAPGRTIGALEDYEREAAGNEIVAEVAPEPRDIVVVKAKPSGFFGTPLLSYLIYLKVDTLLVCGVSTSGCVRATVTDAFSNNFRVGLIEDGCFDRTEAAHAINLFDLNAKYADVVSSAEVLEYVAAPSPAGCSSCQQARSSAGDAAAQPGVLEL